MLDTTKNQGVIEPIIKPEDYIAGSSPIPYEIRIPDGDWTPYLPSEERQHGRFFDSMGCVSFSNLNCVETQLNFFNVSSNKADRFLAKISGTTQAGNSVGNVGEAIRKNGVCLEEEWSWDQQTFTWDKFYSEIPEDVKTKALGFLNNFEVWYERVDGGVSELQEALKHSPVQILVKTCPTWNTGNVQACTGAVNHAVMLYKIDEHGYHILDTYEPYLKVLAPDYIIPWKFKIILKPKNMNYTKVVKQDGSTFGVRIASPNGDQIIYATGEEQWRSWSKADSYRLNTVNPDGTSNFNDCIRLPW